jgi:hypothetical protein
MGIPPSPPIFWNVRISKRSTSNLWQSIAYGQNLVYKGLSPLAQYLCWLEFGSKAEVVSRAEVTGSRSQVAGSRRARGGLRGGLRGGGLGLTLVHTRLDRFHLALYSAQTTALARPGDLA